MHPVGRRVEQIARQYLVVIGEHRDYRPIGDELAAQRHHPVDDAEDAGARRRPGLGGFRLQRRHLALGGAAAPGHAGQQHRVEQQQECHRQCHISGDVRPQRHARLGVDEPDSRLHQDRLHLRQGGLGAGNAIIDAELRVLDIEFRHHHVGAGQRAHLAGVANLAIGMDHREQQRQIEYPVPIAHIEAVDADKAGGNQQQIGDRQRHVEQRPAAALP